MANFKNKKNGIKTGQKTGLKLNGVGGSRLYLLSSIVLVVVGVLTYATFYIESCNNNPLDKWALTGSSFMWVVFGLFGLVSWYFSNNNENTKY